MSFALLVLHAGVAAKMRIYYEAGHCEDDEGHTKTER